MRLRKPSPWELLMLRGIANYQFGWPAGDVLIGDDVVVGISPATRRIREVYGDEGLLAVLRAHDYLFSLSLLGAERLRAAFEPPRLRAIVSRDWAGRGVKSVSCSDVVDVDPELFAGEEVIVVSEDDSLVGVGRLRMSPVEIRERQCRGEAVRLRKLVRQG